MTAEKRSAKPIAQLTLNSINALEGFSVVFWAKLCQRTGGWAVPVPMPSRDVDGTPFTPATHRKASGLREEETSTDHTSRVAGIMRVYFSLLLLPPSRPLPREFQLPRFWTFVARLVTHPALLRSSLATELLSGVSLCFRLSSMNDALRSNRTFSRSRGRRRPGSRGVGLSMDQTYRSALRGRDDRS